MEINLFRRRRATLEELAQGQHKMLAVQQRLAIEELESGRMTQSIEVGEPRSIEDQSRARRALDFLPSRKEEEVEDAEERRKSIEDTAVIGKGGEVRLWEGGPTSIPTTLTPEAQETAALQLPRSSNSPLFSEQQVQKMAQLEHQAPLLQSRREELQRPQWMTEEDEKARLEEERKEEYRQRQMRFLMMHDDEKARMLRINCDLQMDCKKAEAEGKALQHENWKIAKDNEAIRKENEALKQKIRSYQKIMEEGDGQGAEQPWFQGWGIKKK